MGRFKRQLPLLSKEGQRKLSKASVLIVGLGGIGSSVSLYLTSAGIGCLGLCDFDKVDISNLNRQILYNTRDVGESKVKIAYKKLSALNPKTSLLTYPKISKENIDYAFEHFDIIVDCSGDFETHYLLNEECIKRNKLLVYGGATGFNGNIMTISKESACLNCVFPKGENRQGKCQLSTVNGIIGSLQAGEVIKQILSREDNLINKLLRYDFLSTTIELINVTKDKDCPVCNR